MNCTQKHTIFDFHFSFTLWSLHLYFCSSQCIYWVYSLFIIYDSLDIHLLQWFLCWNLFVSLLRRLLFDWIDLLNQLCTHFRSQIVRFHLKVLGFFPDVSSKKALDVFMIENCHSFTEPTHKLHNAERRLHRAAPIRVGLRIM